MFGKLRPMKDISAARVHDFIINGMWSMKGKACSP